MPEPKVLVVVDTTAVHSDWTMSGLNWSKLWALASRQFLRLAVPEIVVLEASRQMIDHVNAAETKARQHIAEVKTQYGRLREVGIPMYRRARMTGDNDAPLDRSRLASAIANRITSSGGEVLPLPNVSHEVVVNRDLDRHKPFQPSGKGYRDTLTWHSILERLRLVPAGQKVLFVTDNSDDYATKDGGLDPGLRKELPTGIDVQIVRKLSELFERSDIQELTQSVADSAAANNPQLNLGSIPWATDDGEVAGTMEDVVSNLATTLAGSLISTRRQPVDNGVDFEEVELPPEVWDSEIQQVEIDRTSIQWAVYDVMMDSALAAEISVNATVHASGVVESEYYYYGRPDGLDLVGEIEGRRDLARVNFRLSVTLQYVARTNSDSSAIEAVRLDRASPREPG